MPPFWACYTKFMFKSRWFQKSTVQALILIYVFVIVWWFLIHLRGIQETNENYAFSLVYSIMPLGWGLLGFLNARRWGGLKSSMGRAMMFLSAGLFAWGVGNLIFAYYNLVLQVAVPYPSLADAGFFLLYPLSAIGIMNFFRVTGASFALRKMSGKTALLIIPLSLIFLSYYLLFVVARGGVITYEGDVLKLVLDIAFPVGDVVVVTLAAVVYWLSYKYLGGKFRKPIVFIIVGFISTYFADFLFSYTTTTETYFVGKWVDLFYPTAFLFISLGLSLLDPRSLANMPSEHQSIGTGVPK